MMKYLRKVFLALIFLPFQLLAQPAFTSSKDITGLWQGQINTAQKKLPYELVIAEKDGKLVVYSLTIFFVNEEEIISIKKMKIGFQKERIIIEDDDMLFNNFTSEAAKKIKQTNTLVIIDEGFQLVLSGTFETKTNRALRPASGDVYLIKKEDPGELKLIAKLQEMNLATDLSFLPKKQLGASALSEASSLAVITQASIKKEEVSEIILPEVFVTIQPLPIKEELRLIYTRPKNNTYNISKAKPLSPITIAAILNTTSPTKIVAKPTVVVKPTIVTKPLLPITVVKTQTVIAKTNSVVKTAPKNIEVAPVINLATRKIETIQQLYIESDSLVLTLYDNGEVDGDSVSIILNGKTIVSQQRLSTTAFTKTIYITPELGDTIQLVMYAENLGSLPPNTGLLLLQFDNKRHEIRFSGDLNKNAAITLRRKEKE